MFDSEKYEGFLGNINDVVGFMFWFIEDKNHDILLIFVEERCPCLY